MQYLFFTIKLYLILEHGKKCVSYIIIVSRYPFFFLEKEGEKRKNQEFQKIGENPENPRNLGNP